jgi:hypothetical protein
MCAPYFSMPEWHGATMKNVSINYGRIATEAGRRAWQKRKEQDMPHSQKSFSIIAPANPN